MLRILFLVLWIILQLGPQAHGAVEIYANGHEYDSLQAYLASKKSAKSGTPSTPVSLNSQQEDYIRKEAEQLGINVDFSKVKTLQVNQEKLSEADLHKLYVLSVENGVVGALRDFYSNPIGRSITVAQLKEAIAQAVTTSKDPKFLISRPGKVRIMSLTAQESPK